MIPQIPKLFVILVHYGDVEATRRAVASFQEGSVIPDMLLIVDHGDTPVGSSIEGAGIETFRPPTNSGYSGGILAGVGFLSARGAQPHDIVVCVNNDAEVAPEALEVVRDTLRAQNDPQLLGVQAGSVNMVTGRADLGESMHHTWYQYPYLHGSFYAAPFRVFGMAQLPSEYFLYWEDVVWSWRLADQGVRLVLLPPDLVQHPDTRSPSEQQQYYLVRNGAYTLARYRGPWRPYWRMVNALRLLYHRLISRKAVVVQALSDARASRLGRRRI